MSGTTAEVPVPEISVFPEDNMVHPPTAGNPSKVTVPAILAQVGTVTSPTVGAGGVTGCVLIVIVDGDEVHPSEFKTVYE